MQRGTSLSIIELTYSYIPTIGISWWGGTRELGIGN